MGVWLVIVYVLYCSERAGHGSKVSEFVINNGEHPNNGPYIGHDPNLLMVRISNSAEKEEDTLPVSSMI